MQSASKNESLNSVECPADPGSEGELIVRLQAEVARLKEERLARADDKLAEEAKAWKAEAEAWKAETKAWKAEVEQRKAEGKGWKAEAKAWKAEVKQCKAKGEEWKAEAEAWKAEVEQRKAESDEWKAEANAWKTQTLALKSNTGGPDVRQASLKPLDGNNMIAVMTASRDCSSSSVASDTSKGNLGYSNDTLETSRSLVDSAVPLSKDNVVVVNLSQILIIFKVLGRILD